MHINVQNHTTSCLLSVEGYCRGVPAGEIIVGWNVGDCPNQKDFDVGDSYTGWFQTSRIIVEELAIQNATDVIV